MKLTNVSTNRVLAENVTMASTFYSRLKGLLGTSNMRDQSALWISQCNSIHTCFMKFAIDALFVDENLIVVRAYENIRPWRMTRILFRARSVFELPGGTLKRVPTCKGDQLYVGH